MLQTRSFLIALGVLFVHSNAFTNVALRQASHTSAQFAATTSDSAPSTPKQLTLFSPSKINLFLRILRKRSDGYHDLASLFQAIGFGDTLTLSILDDDDDDSSEATPHDILTCNMPGVPIDTSNLVVRALQLIREKTNSQVYFRASLIKQVPAKAGLGGGSANAATALYGANILLGRPATIKELIAWSADLGSDITFFLSQGTAYCTGRGEIMDAKPPISHASGQKVCIVKPDIGLSTPLVFQNLNYEQLSPLDPDKTLLPAFLAGIETVPDEYFVNDLEAPAFYCVPELAELKNELQQEGFDHVLMSGSGTSIFCLGEPSDKVAFDTNFGQRAGLQVFYTEFVSRESDSWYERPTRQ